MGGKCCGGQPTHEVVLTKIVASHRCCEEAALPEDEVSPESATVVQVPHHTSLSLDYSVDGLPGLQQGFHPVVRSGSASLKYIRVVDGESLSERSLIRHSTKEAYEGVLRPEDVVVAVSHAWSFEKRKDDGASKPSASSDQRVRAMRELVREASHQHVPTKWPAAFFDYPAVAGCKSPQVLQALPWLFLRSDAIVHVESFDAASYEGDGLPVADEKEDAAKIPEPESPACPSDMSERDMHCWILFERFLTTLKIAMLSGKTTAKVAFSNSPTQLTELTLDASRIRTQYQNGGLQGLQKALQTMLAQFELECLTGKRAPRSGMPDQAMEDAAMASKDVLSFADPHFQTARDMLREVVAVLSEQWEEEVSRCLDRQLFLAVWRGDQFGCRRLLQHKANPNARGAMHITPLHYAAQSLDVPIAKALLEHSADIFTQDARGCCPAHVVALEADSNLLDMLSSIAPTARVMQVQNKAGRTPLRRLAEWAPTALNGSPFLSAVAYVEAGVAASKASMEPLRAPVASVSVGELLVGMQAHSSNPMMHFKRELKVNGVSRPFDTWEPRGVIMMDVLVLAVGQVPWQMVKPAVGCLAHVLCSRFRARVIALHAESVPVVHAGVSQQYFCNALMEVIAALNLHTSTVLADFSGGAAVPLVWELRPQLSGVLIVNVAGWWSQSFMKSSDFEQLTQHFCNLSDGIARSKEAVLRSIPLSSIHKNAALGKDESTRDVQGSADMYTAVMLGRNAAQRDLSAMLFQWHLRDVGAFLNRAQPLEQLPMVIACSSHAPEPVQMSCLRFGEELVPFARWAVIPQSILWWEVEGAKQVTFLIELLSFLCAQVGAGRL